MKNNFWVKANKRIISTPKIVIEKPLIVEEPKVVKKVDKAEIVIEKNPHYGEFKNRVIKQLKKYFKKLRDAKKVSI